MNPAELYDKISGVKPRREVLGNLEEGWHSGPMRIKPWVSDAVEVKKSGMEGKGVYSVRAIKKGEVVGVFGGIVMPEEDIETLKKTVPADKLNIDHAMYIYPGFIMLHDYLNGCDPLCFVNHACTPSAHIENGIILLASRDIPAGEEISWDYRKTDNIGNWSYEFDCHCGTASCTGKVQVGPQFRTKVTVTSN